MVTQIDGNTDYKYLTIRSSELYLKFSTVQDSLPITSFKLSDGYPCMRSDEKNIRKGKYLFDLEIPMGYGCSKDFNNDVYNDARYKSASAFSVNEYDLMNANQILTYV